MATVYLHGVDIEAEWPQIEVARLPDALHRAETLLAGVTIPGMAGQLVTGPVEVPPREFSIGLLIDETSVLGVRQRLQEIRSLVGAHVIEVRIADGLELSIEARCVGGDALAIGPALATDWANAELRFVADHPYWRDRWASIYHIGGTLVPLPMGNAPTAPIWEVFSADGNDVTSPAITVCDHTGTPRRVSTFTGLVIPGTDVLTIETAVDRMAILYSTAGVVAQNDALLPSGQLLPASLDPYALGNPYLQHFPMVKVTAASGTPAARVTYPRHFL